MTETELYNDFVKPRFESIGWFTYHIDYNLVPDVYLTQNSVVTWLELKVVDSIIRGEIKPDWRTGQLSWIQLQKSYGTSNVGVAVYIESLKECRIYHEAKKVFTEKDMYYTIKRS